MWCSAVKTPWPAIVGQFCGIPTSSERLVEPLARDPHVVADVEVAVDVLEGGRHRPGSRRRAGRRARRTTDARWSHPGRYWPRGAEPDGGPRHGRGLRGSRDDWGLAWCPQPIDRAGGEAAWSDGSCSGAVTTFGDRPGGPAPRRCCWSRPSWASWSPRSLPTTARSSAVPPAADRGRRASPRPRARWSHGSCARPTLANQGGQAGAGIAPVRARADRRVGVATYNMFRRLPTAQAAADARRLTADPEVDVVGWQEADPFRRRLHDLPGWTTATFGADPGAAELAVSWRSSEFRLVSAAHAQGRARPELARGPLPVRQPLCRRRPPRAPRDRPDPHRARHPPAAEDRGPRPTPAAGLDDQRDPGPGPAATASPTSGGTRPAAGSSARATSTSAPAPTRRDRPSAARGRRFAAGRSPPTSCWATDRRAHAPPDRAQHRLRLARPARPGRPDRIDVRSQRVLDGYHSDHRPLLARLRLS